eukprot:6177014-Pleurochrysis_carterae.AAC.1
MRKQRPAQISTHCRASLIRHKNTFITNMRGGSTSKMHELSPNVTHASSFFFFFGSPSPPSDSYGETQPDVSNVRNV